VTLTAPRTNAFGAFSVEMEKYLSTVSNGGSEKIVEISWDNGLKTKQKVYATNQ
jgi:hypothetical protein